MDLGLPPPVCYASTKTRASYHSATDQITILGFLKAGDLMYHPSLANTELALEPHAVQHAVHLYPDWTQY